MQLAKSEVPTSFGIDKDILFIKLLHESTANIEFSDEMKEMFLIFSDKDAIQGAKDFV